MDGIRLGDFVEAEISDNEIEFSKVPTMLVIRKNLSKASISTLLSFLSRR